MQYIKKNDAVAIAGEWFAAHGKAVNKGYFGLPQDKEIADKMRVIFSAWIDNGHNNFDDLNTIILAVELTDGVPYSNGTQYVF